MLSIFVGPEKVRPKLSSIQGIRANLVYIVSLKQPLKQINPAQQSRQQVLRAFYPNLYTVLVINSLTRTIDHTTYYEINSYENLQKKLYLILVKNKLSSLIPVVFSQLSGKSTKDTFGPADVSQSQWVFFMNLQTIVCSHSKVTKVNSKILLMKSSENDFIFSPAFYLIMCLMKAPKSFEKIVIFKT